jgi:autotransporter-associated beta strand protein
MATPAVAALLFSNPAKAATLYWDTNVDTPGAGVTPTGTWDNAALTWGTVNGDTFPGAWTNGNEANFSAGTDAVGAYTVTIAAGTTIGAAGAGNGVEGITFDDGVVTIAAGDAASTLTLSAPTVAVNSTSATIGAIVAGTSGLTKTGTGTLTLTNALNSFSGTVGINGGILSIGSNGALGNTSNSLDFNSGTLNITASLGAAAGTPWTRNISLTGNGLINASAGGATFHSGVISGAGNLEKTGTTTFVLMGTNTYSGTTTATSGTLVSTGINSLGDNSPTNTVILNGGVLRFSADYNETRALNLTASSSLDVSNFITPTTNTATYSGNITGGAGFNLTKISAGTLFVSGTNTYAGNTIVAGGRLVPTSTAALPGYNAPGRISTTATAAILAPAAGGGGQWNSADIDTLAANTTFIASGRFGIHVDSANTFTKTTGTVGAFNFVKVGGGILELNATGNTYTGTTEVTEGTLRLIATDSLPATALNVNGGTLNNNGFNQTSALITLTSGTITGAGTLTSNIAAASTGFNLQSGTLSSNLAGAGNLTKTTAGTATITVPQSYTGTSNVSAGVLQVNNTTGSGVGTGTLTIASGGTLSGTGTIGPLTSVSSGGKINAGTVGGVGTLTTSTLTLASGSLPVFEFTSGSNDLVNVTTAAGLTLSGGNFTITDLGSGIAAGNVYTLIDYAGLAFAGGGVGNTNILNSPPAGLDWELLNDNTAVPTYAGPAGAIKLRVFTASPTGSAGSWVLDGSGSWVDGVNWFGGTVPSGADATATFAATTPNNPAKTVTVSGSAKTVGTITFNSPTSYAVSGGAPMQLDQTDGSALVEVLQGNHSLNTPQSLLDDTSYNIASGSTLSIGDVISSPSSKLLIKDGLGTLTLNSKPTVVATVNAGILNGSLGTVATPSLATIPQAVTLAGSGIVHMFTAAGGGYSGVISGAAPSSKAIFGAGTGSALSSDVITGNNTFTGTAYGYFTTLTLSGANGAFSGAAGVDLFHGSLVLENATNNTNRLGAATSVTMRGAGLTMNGNATTLSTESFGNLVPSGGGFNYVTITPGTAGATLTGTQYTAGGGAVLVRGTLLGTGAGAFSQLKFASPPAVTGLGTPSATVLRGMLADDTGNAATGAVATLATYDTNGVRMITPAETTATAATGVNYAPIAAATVTGLTLGAIELGGGGNVAAIGGFTTTLSGTVTVSSGTVYSNATTAGTITGGTLALGTGGVIANFTSTLTIASAINSTGFTKVGNGQLTLTGSNNFNSGRVNLDQGITLVNSPTRLNGASVVSIGAAGALSAATQGLQAGQLQLTGSGTYTMPMEIHGNYPVGTQTSLTGPASFNQASGTNTWSGDISLMGRDLNTANNLYPGIAVQAGTLTLSGVIKNGTRPDGAGVVSAAFYTSGAGDIVFSGGSPNTFTNFMRPFGGRLIVEKDGAFGTGNNLADPTDQFGVQFTAGSAATNSKATIAFRSATSLNYATTELIRISGTGVNQDGIFLQNLGGANTFAGAIAFGSDYTLAGFNNPFRMEMVAGSLELSGPMIAGTTAARDFLKEGPGSFLVSYNNTLAASSGLSSIGSGSKFYVKAGSLVVKGNGAMSTGIGNYIVSPGGSIVLDNSSIVNTSRIAGAAVIDLVGGELKLIGNPVTPFVQPAGTLNVGSYSTLTVQADPTTPQSTTLSFGVNSIRGSGRGTALLRGVDGNGKIELGGTTLGGGINGGSLTSILPYVVGNTSSTGDASDFVTINAGFARVLTGADYIPLASGNNALDNTTVTANQSIAADTKVNSLKMSGTDTVLTIGTSLFVDSGAILSVASGVNSKITGGELHFGKVLFAEDPNDPEQVILTATPDREGVVTVPAGAKLTIESMLRGGQGLTKSGNGTLTLNNALNDYGFKVGGATTINSGVLEFSVNGDLGFSTAPIFLNGGTLRPLQTSTSARAITLQSVGLNAIDTGSGANFTVSGLVTGSVASNVLTKNGPGTLTLTNLNNSYGGGTVINDGQMPITTGGVVGGATAFGPGLIQLNGGQLRMDSNLVLDRSLASASTNTTGGFWIAPGVTVTFGSGAASTVGMSGSGNYAINGGGILALSQNTGTNMVYTGRLIVNDGSTLQFDSVGTNVIPGLGGTPIAPTEWVVLNGAASRLKFNVTSNLGTGFSASSRGITVNSGGTIDISGTNHLIYTGTAGIVGTGTITKDGTGLYSLRTTSSTFNGKWNVAQGTLEFGAPTNNAGSLGTGSGADFITIANGATLQGTTTSATTTLGATQGITLSGGTATIGTKGAQLMTLNGAITGNANLNFAGNGFAATGVLSGPIVLTNAANNYTGDTNILGSGTTNATSIVRSGVTNALPVTTTLNLNAGSGTAFATFDLGTGANSFDQTVAGITNSALGTNTVTNSGTNVRTFTVNNATANTYGGVLSGALRLAKTGAGTLTLTGAANTYTGSTTVTAGAVNSVLKSGVNGALPATTVLTLTNGVGTAQFDIDGKTQTLAGIAGNGSVIDTATGGALTINTAGTVTPGTSPGTLTISTGLTLNNNVVFNYDLANTTTVGGGVNDLLVGNPVASAGGNTFTLNINAPGDLTGGTYTLIDGTTIAGSLAAQFAIGTNNAPGAANFTYAFNVVSNDLVLEVTPIVVGDIEWKKFSGSNSGNWGDAGHWSGAIPSGLDAIARFRGGPVGALVDGNATVTMDSARTVGTVIFDNAANSYTIAGANAVTIDTAAGNGTVTVTGNHVISAPLVLNKPTDFTVNASSSLLASNLTATGQNVTKAGAGTLEVNHVRANNVTVSAGVLKTTAIANLASSLSVSPAVSKVNSLIVSGTGSVELTNSRIITKDAQGTEAGGIYSGVQGLVQSGKIFSLEPLIAANQTRIGVATAAESKSLLAGQTTLWSGQTVDDTDILVMYTWAGDANLDGKVNADDYASIDLYSTVPGADSWNHGDFNYNGVINADDYALIDNNVQNPNYTPIWTTDALRILESGGGSATAGLTAVPEPASVSVLALGALSLLGRRSRREKK